MTFQQMQNVLEIYRAGSISQAAKNMFVSQSSLSVSLSALESALGFPIFLRNAQGIMPTIQGMQVIEHAIRICDSYQSLQNISSTTTVRNVRISFMDHDPFNRAYCRLLEENSGKQGVLFTQRIDSIQGLIGKSVAFEVDVGICACMQNNLRATEVALEEAGLQWEILGSYPVCIILGPGHRMYHQEAVTLRDLENDMLVETSRREAVNNPVLRGLADLSEEKLLTCGRGKIIYALVNRGLGYMIGRPPCAETVEKYQLRLIPIGELEGLFVAITNPHRPLPEEARRFLEIVKEEMSH